MDKRKYEPTTAYEAFGRLMTIVEVCEEVPLMLCMDGPREGWVFDMRFARDPNEGDGQEFQSMYGAVTYEYRGQLVRAEDGRLMREMWIRPQSAPDGSETAKGD